MNDIDTFLQSYLPISDARAEAKKLMPALINSESNGKNVPSYKGDQVATGPAQLSPAAAKDVGLTEEERHEPVKNAQGGEDYLNTLIDKYKDRRTALIAYNWGQNKVDKFGVEKAPKSSKDYAEKILSAKPQEDKKPKITSVDDFLAAYTPKNTAEKVKGIPLPIGGKEFAPEIEKEHTLGEKVVGGLEAGLSTVSAIPAIVAAPIDTAVAYATGTQKGSLGDTYESALGHDIIQPKTEAGKEYTNAVGEFSNRYLAPLGPVGHEVGGILRSLKTNVDSAKVASKLATNTIKEEAASLRNLYREGSPEGSVIKIAPHPTEPVDYTKPPISAGTVEDQITAELKAEGYVLPPNQAKPGKINSILEALSGKSQLEADASGKNHIILDNMGRETIGVKEDAPLGKDTYDAVRRREGNSFQAIKDLPENFSVTEPFKNVIKQIGKVAESLSKKTEGVIDSKKIVKLREGLLNLEELTPEEAIELSKALRQDAADNLGWNASGKQKKIGRAQRVASNAVDDMIESNLERLGKTDLLNNWRESRKVIAITYELERATNQAGHVDARKLALRLQKGAPLTGKLKKAAQLGANYKRSARPPQEIGVVHDNIERMTGLFALMSLLSGRMSLSTVGEVLMVRPALRGMLLSDTWQNRMGTPKLDVMPTYPKGMDMTPKPVEMPKQSPRSKRIVVEPEETKKASYITGTPYRMDETTGRLVSESRGLPGATPDVIYSADKDLKSAQQKLYTGRKFDLTAEERIALAKYDAEVLQAGPSKNKVVEGGKIPNEQPKTSLTSGIPYTMSGEKLVQETPKGTTLTEPVSDLQNAAKKIQEGRAHELTPEEKISWAKKQIEILRPGAAYKQKKIYPPEEQVKYNKENKKDARRIKPIEDVRLKNPEVQTELKAMAEESGWAEIGGKGIWDEEKGAYKEERTTWLKNNPRSKWYGAGLGSREFIIEAVRKAIAGEPMYAPEKYVVKHMINYIDEEVFPLITEFTPEELDSVGAFEYENAETDALDRALGTTLEKNEADWADMGGKTTTDTKNLNTEQIDELLGKKVKK